MTRARAHARKHTHTPHTRTTHTPTHTHHTQTHTTTIFTENRPRKYREFAPIDKRENTQNIYQKSDR